MTDDDILTTILRHEGGWSDHPNDTGRCTHWGITARTLSDWRGKPVTCEDVKALTVEEAKDIYRARYLKPFASVEPGSLKAQVVDIAVNSGVTTARGMLAMARLDTSRPVHLALAVQRLKHYARIVKSRPTQAVFLHGWVNRAAEYIR